MRHYDYEPIPTSNLVAHPDCPKCGATMYLSEIEPDEPDYDRRKFECIECGINVIKIVKFK